MTKKRILILGCNVAGFTAALGLKDFVHSRHDVTVISRVDRFLFQPSLVRISLGARTADQASFAVRGIFAEHGIAFREESALRLDLDARKVVTPSTEERYDFLVIATGAKPNYGAVPGLGPRGYTHSLSTIADAERARTSFEALLRSPGPVVIGDVQGSSCRTPAYELLINLMRLVSERGLTQAIPITYLTAGPSTAIPGVSVIANAAIAEISPCEIRLAGGQWLPFAWALLLPPSLGVDAIRGCQKITDAAGFVRVNPFMQTEAHPEVFAAGTAVAGEPLEKSGAVAENMAQRAARNLFARLSGEPMGQAAELQRSGNLSASPQASDEGWLVPGPEHAWSRAAFERYFPRQLGDEAHSLSNQR